MTPLGILLIIVLLAAGSWGLVALVRLLGAHALIGSGRLQVCSLRFLFLEDSRFG
jgi:hypothetical protein